MPRIGEVLEKVITLRGLPRDIINEFLKEHNILLWHPEIQENLKSWEIRLGKELLFLSLAFTSLPSKNTYDVVVMLD